MAKEFKPGSFSGSGSSSCSSSRLFRHDYSSMARKPAKMGPIRDQYACRNLPSSADDRLLSHIADTLKDDKLLMLMRGCPGSGKTTLAKKIYNSLETGKVGLILSTDNYFDKDGSHYQYDSAKLPGAHAWNKSQAFTAMAENTDLIIIDNTNVSKWEMAPYVKLAFENSYKVQLVEPNTNWKFSARRLFEHNIHGVNLNKIKDMLSRYEKNVSVQQLLGVRKQHDETHDETHDSHTDRNPPQVERKSHERRRRRRKNDRSRDRSDRSRDTNNNNSNSDNHSSTSPPETHSAKDSSANDKTEEERLPAIPRVDPEFIAPEFIAPVPRREKKVSAIPKADQEFSDPESWGSDEWCDPKAQRTPKKTAKNPDHFLDSESETEDFQAEVLDIMHSMEKRKPAVVDDLTVLALKCIEKFGNDEIYEIASLAAVEGCQRKNQILLENFERKNILTKPVNEGFTPSTKDEDESLLLAYALESFKESPGSSAPEDFGDISPEEQSEFYVNFAIQSDFTNLLTQMLGPINNLNIEDADQKGNINLKLHVDDMRCLHETLTKICAKGIGSCKKKKTPSKAKRSECMYSPSKDSFLPPPDSLTQIMREQEESRCQLEQKLQRNDDASAKKLKKLCDQFPAYDPNVIEDIFKANDYNMHKTLAVLQGHPQDTAIDWRFDSPTLLTQTAQKDKPRPTNSEIYLNWLKISGQDQTDTVEFYDQRLKDNIQKRNMYCNRRFYTAASYFEEKVGEFKIKLKSAQLDLLKQNIASLFTVGTYNKIDLHGMSKHEVAHIIRECLRDYTKVLEKSSSMKRHLIFITGKGSNSRNKMPVLKPYVTGFLEKNNYQFVKDAGEVKVFL